MTVARTPQILGERRPESKNNKIRKRIDFEMGLSVKFVSPNKGLISKKKMGVNFFSRKITIPGGWGCVRGWFGKRPYFFQIYFFETFPYLLTWVGARDTCFSKNAVVGPKF